MSYIVFETSEKVFLLKTDSAEELCRATKDSVGKCVVLMAELPFASTDEAAEFSTKMIEGEYIESMCKFLKQNVPKGAVLYVQDQRLVQQLTDMGFQPELNI